MKTYSYSQIRDFSSLTHVKLIENDLEFGCPFCKRTFFKIVKKSIPDLEILTAECIYCKKSFAVLTDDLFLIVKVVRV